MLGPVGVLGQWSRDLVTFPDGRVRTSSGGPICFLVSALSELGVASYGCSGGKWRPFFSSGEQPVRRPLGEVAQALATPGYEIAFDEQDTKREPQVMTSSGIVSLAACLRERPAVCPTIIISSIFSDVPAESVAEFRRSNDTSLVLDIQGFQRIMNSNGRIERVPADTRLFECADVIKGNRLEFERQFGSDFGRHLMAIAENHRLLFLLTEGVRGVTIFEPGKEPVIVPVSERSQGSSVGAGDRFLGSFVAYRSRGEGVGSAVRLAQAWVGSALSLS